VIVERPIHLDYLARPGTAQARFLKGITERKILGERCPKCNKVYCPPRGSCPTDGVATVPVSATSTNSLSSAPVTGSYSWGGTMTRPSVPRMPSMRPSANELKKRSITGPTLRVYGYSTT
jgi:hypothetical protein